MNKTGVYIILLFIALTGIVFFAESPERILGTSNALKNERNIKPFAVAHNTETSHYEESGKLSYTFVAKRLEHYRDEEKPNEDNMYTLIDLPELVFYQEDQPWFIHAQKGKIINQTQQIELWDQVLVKHTNADGITTTIATEKLNIDPLGKLAETDEPVKISSDKVEINGTGMIADFALRKLKLRSKVHGFYDPT